MVAPRSDEPVPADMVEVLGEPVVLVWRNEAGGLTGRSAGPPARFVKWNPAGSIESLTAEAERLRWLAGRHPAPEVLDHVRTAGAELLVTRALPGRSAVDPAWVARPADAIRAIARGLRALHTLAVGDCPFDWGVASRVSAAAAAGRAVPTDLLAAPEIDRLVVCHGDACAPNTLVADDGTFAATVDVGRLGTADRWADLAVATMSFAWNYADVDESVFWDAYGVEPDAGRIAYYRALWNAT